MTEISIVMPCLNEADTLATCIEKAYTGLRNAGAEGEIIVADNGSTDGSQEIATRLGARVVHVTEKGYGSALMGGIAAANGTYVLMGDADDSYDFAEIPRFVERLRDGHDLVQGCRRPSGGGTIEPGAMPFLHRWIGNPLFSFLVRAWFSAPINDVYCGMRAFRKEHYERLDQRCTGMEFATEMIIKSTFLDADIVEVPITLHPDGRQSHPPHLKTFRDGWRTLRFFLIYTPRWLFLIPGLVLMVLGVAGLGLGIREVSLGRVTFSVNSTIFASLALICGYQSCFVSMFARTFAVNEGLLPAGHGSVRLTRLMTLERWLAVGGAALGAGVALLALAVNRWRVADFGALGPDSTRTLVVPGATLVALGLQTIFSSFFLSVLGLRRR